MKNIRRKIWFILLVILLMAAIFLIAGIGFGSRKNGIDRTGDQTQESVTEGYLQIAVQESLDMENPEKALQLTKAATVRLDAFGKQNFSGEQRSTGSQEVSGNQEIWTGTAVIWDQTKEQVILVTSAHLLEMAEEKLLVSFRTEDETTAFEMPAAIMCGIIGISQEMDLGFVSFDKAALTEETLQKLRCVKLHQRTYDTLAGGDLCFAAGSSMNGVADLERSLEFVQKDFTDDAIGNKLFLFEGACEPGMSGSGVFDGYGHFIGMVVATDETRTLAIPMEDINAAYRKLTGRTRDTEDYL